MNPEKPSFDNEASSEQPRLPSREEIEVGRIERARDLNKYLEFLSLNIDDLRGKTILDVGSGKGMFAKQLKEKGIETVYSVDPFFEPYKQESSPGVVKGFAETLPFKDEAFDLEVALYSVPYYSKTPEQVHAVFSQLLRALKPGGEIRIFPLFSLPDTPEEIAKRQNATGWAQDYLRQHDGYPFRFLSEFQKALEEIQQEDVSQRYNVNAILKSEPPMRGRVGMLRAKLPRFEWWQVNIQKLPQKDSGL